MERKSWRASRTAVLLCSNVSMAAGRYSGSHPAAIAIGAIGHARACSCRWSTRCWATSLGLTEGGPIRLRETDQAGPAEPDVEPGVYDRGGYHEIVNVNARESETDRATVAEFADQFRCNTAAEELNTGTDTVTAGIASSELRQDEVWHWALMALVTMLLAEGFLANRTTV